MEGTSAGEMLFKALFSFIAKALLIMWAWDYVMPTFGLHELTFLQAMAIEVLGECIFQSSPVAVTKKA